MNFFLTSQFCDCCYLLYLFLKKTDGQIIPNSALSHQNLLLVVQRHLSEHFIGNLTSCAKYVILRSIRYQWVNQMIIFEPPHDKTNKMACVPSEDKKAWILSYPLSAQQRLWSDWADAQADLSFRWVHSHFVGFVIRGLINDALDSNVTTMYFPKPKAVQVFLNAGWLFSFLKIVFPHHRNFSVYK